MSGAAEMRFVENSRLSRVSSIEYFKSLRDISSRHGVIAALKYDFLVTLWNHFSFLPDSSRLKDSYGEYIGVE